MEALDYAVLRMLEKQTDQEEATQVTPPSLEPDFLVSAWRRRQGDMHGGKLFTVGLLAGVSYGDVISGASPARVAGLRLAQRQALGANKPGVRAAIMRQVTRCRDPAFMQLAPLRRYHQEWWMAHVLQDQRCLTVGTLVEAFRAAKEEFSQGTASWKAAASGPMKLAIWAANPARVGLADGHDSEYS